MKGTTKIIQRIQEILMEDKTNTISYASMRAGLELGYDIDQIKQALEEYRTCGL